VCDQPSRESFLIRLWAEPDEDRAQLRGFIQHVPSGHKTYFHSLELPLALLRESAGRLHDHPGRTAPVA
jgi:hypothetical protein